MLEWLAVALLVSGLLSVFGLLVLALRAIWRWLRRRKERDAPAIPNPRDSTKKHYRPARRRGNFLKAGAGLALLAGIMVLAL